MLGLLYVLATSAQDPDLSVDLSKVAGQNNKMAPIVARFSSDRSEFDRLYFVTHDEKRYEALTPFLHAWRKQLDKLNFDSFGVGARVDWIMLRNKIDSELAQLKIDEERLEEASVLLPFLDMVVEFESDRRNMKVVDPQAMAQRLDDELDQLKAMEKEQEVSEFVALRAGNIGRDLQRSMRQWFSFYNGYDPMFTWWIKTPYDAFNKEMSVWLKHVNEKLGGVKAGDNEAILGDPIGRDALMVDLEREMIPYTPEELVKIADKELAWCQAEMRKAAKEMGYDNYMDAMEKVKTLHVEPGEQPEMIRFMAFEAIEFIEENELMTIPVMAKTSWQMDMMTQQRQLVNPFFTGGPVISVAFPTDTMSHDQKLMSLRGNNRHFARATVHHELIPGHHMQQYMNRRYNTHRRAFSTPFYGEGWALYWELLFWDLNFQKSPENRMGMLFWRSHRAARIKFSLGFHLGQMTKQECIDLLVNVVGHEQKNAEAEVRRSFFGNYAPLYQCAYMLGGLQINALRKELVENGNMSYREFHDKVVTQNAIPIEMMRALVMDTKLEKDYKTNWRFYGNP